MSDDALTETTRGTRLPKQARTARVLVIALAGLLALSAVAARAWPAWLRFGAKKQSPPPPTLTVDEQRLRLDTDFKRLRALTRQLRRMETEMETLRQSLGAVERGYYTADEHEQVERLLFRYLICRESLWDIIDYYRGFRENFSEPELQARGFLVGFDAGLWVAYCSSTLVDTFVDSPMVIAKLNEKYHRSEIERGTYDTLFRAVTKTENINAIRAAWTLFEQEQANPDSALARLLRAEPEMAAVRDEMVKLHETTQERIRHILARRSLLLPAVRNRLRQSAVAALMREVKRKTDDNLDAAQAVLFLNVSRLQDPFAYQLSFTDEQVDAIRARLQPGDIVLTFSAGYMSNVFLPGAFKHGITYVGKLDDRRALGLKGGAIDPAHADRGDLVEAVAEGVIFNSLEQILHGHVYRLAVLRPRVSEAIRRRQLETVFDFLGDDYDFDFDFNDASAQCCTEVIYRSLQGQGPVRFRLVPRLGRHTLSADDILTHAIDDESESFFKVILLAEEDPATDSRGRARILAGDDADRRLRTTLTANRQ